MMRFEIIVLLFLLVTTVAWATEKELTKAIQSGDVALVKELLDSGADLGKLERDGNGPMYWANTLEMVELLLAHGAHVENVDQSWRETPLERAAERWTWDRERREEWYAMTQRMRKAGATYSVAAAILLDDVEFIRSELTKDTAWINRRTRSHGMPLALAARHGRLEICQLLLEHHADPNAWKENSGFSVIYFATKHPAIVKILIEHGANLRRRITFRGDRTGYWLVDGEASILHYAVNGGNLESVKLLVEAGVDPNATDLARRTPLHIAVMSERLWRLNALARREYAEDGQPVDETKSPYESIIKYLIEQDASLEFKDIDRCTPRDLAEKFELPVDLIDLLDPHLQTNW